MARKQLSPNPMPTWLSNISESSNFSKEELIEGSVYYPGSGIDRSIIHAYSGFAHSFIYSDYGVEKSFVLENFKKLEGYSVLLLKELNGHDDLIGTFQDLTLTREDFYPEVDQSRSISVRLQHLEAKLRHLHDPSDQDFCIWIVYQRRLTANVGHGPERISLLYVRGEGVATYKTIYNKNNLKPIAIVINKADIGFGRNWTLFEQNNGVFERTVLANTAGKPKYLFADDRYDPECRRNYFTQSPYWSDYTTEVPNRSFLQIWENGSKDSAKKIRAQSKKLSKAFINWYNDRALHIWQLYPGIHPYLPKVLGTQFDIDADICYVGMNPSFNTDEIRKMMRSDADRSFLTSNEGLWSAFEPELRTRLAQLDASVTVGQRVRSVLLEALPGGGIEMEDVARRVGMSRRTLQRHLESEGLTYTDLLQSTRHALAEHYLVKTDLPVAEISFLLGFEEPNSFFRAFRGWCSQSPERFREASRSHVKLTP